VYNILEVLFFHQPGSDKEKNLMRLQERIRPNFEVEGLEFITATEFDESRQVVRIASVADEFESAQDLDERIRLFAPQDEFSWRRIGAVPAGETETVVM
jgi:hypothetical protein